MLPLGSPASAYDQSLVEAFRDGLRDAGLVENRHVALEVAWIAREPDTYQVVDGLLDRGVKLLVPCGSSARAASLRQTKTSSIVFISVVQTGSHRARQEPVATRAETPPGSATCWRS